MSVQKENLVFTTRLFAHNAEPVTPISSLYLRLTHSSDSLSVCMPLGVCVCVCVCVCAHVCVCLSGITHVVGT